MVFSLHFDETELPFSVLDLLSGLDKDWLILCELDLLPGVLGFVAEDVQPEAEVHGVATHVQPLGSFLAFTFREFFNLSVVEVLLQKRVSDVADAYIGSDDSAHNTGIGVSVTTETDDLANRLKVEILALLFVQVVVERTIVHFVGCLSQIVEREDEGVFDKANGFGTPVSLGRIVRRVEDVAVFGFALRPEVDTKFDPQDSTGLAIVSSFITEFFFGESNRIFECILGSLFVGTVIYQVGNRGRVHENAHSSHLLGVDYFGVLVDYFLVVLFLLICRIGGLEDLGGPDCKWTNFHQGSVTLGHVIDCFGDLINIFGLTLSENHVPVFLELTPVSSKSSQGATYS